MNVPLEQTLEVITQQPNSCSSQPSSSASVHPATRSRVAPPWIAWSASLGSFLLYGLLFSPLRQLLGDAVSAFSLFPVLVFAWFFGVWAGLLSGIAMFFINLALLGISQKSEFVVFMNHGGAPGSLVIILGGLVVGKIANMDEVSNRTAHPKRTN